MIRFIEPKDVNLIADMIEDLHKESKHNYVTFDKEKVYKQLMICFSSENFCYVVEQNKDIVGFCIMKVEEMFFSRAKISQNFILYVKPDFRGSFFIRGLLKECIKNAKCLGCVEVSFSANGGINQKRLNEMFTKLGMIEESRKYRC